MQKHSVKTPNADYCYFHMEILYADIYKFVTCSMNILGLQIYGLYNLMDVHFITFCTYLIV